MKMHKMADNKLIEETLLQIKNLEEVINENAKEILHSTMKEEISELVKESMKDETNEQKEVDDLEIDDEDGSEEIISTDDMGGMEDMEDMDDMDDMTGMEDMDDMDDMTGMEDMDDMDDMDTIDLTDASDEEVLKVFKAMSADDEITVTQDGDYIHLEDDSEDVEYLIQTESTEEMDESKEDELEESYEEMDESKEDELEESYEEMDESEEDELEETIYEVEMDESWLEEDDMMSEIAMSDEESMSPENMTESKKMMSKPKVGKGAKTGSASKFSYKKSKGGFKESMKQGTKGVGMGKAKFEFKESEIFDMPSRTPKLKKSEAKEAARTYGTGWRKGALPKGARAGQESARLHTESVNPEVETLKLKNEEYRKALNLFKDKLNEVAVFNSNLAYATRLFTEHSTSKQEKINILRRFDSAESLKESKALYKTIKEELGSKIGNNSINESIERIIEKEPQSGSAINLIESKTYENPQFLRMKDIMSKIIK
jgi:hypothetical protein